MEKSATMSRLFLHIDTGDLVRDLEGADYASVEDARVEAIQAAREIMSQRVLAGRAPDGEKIIIEDENGRVVLVVRFQDAIGHD